MNRGKRREEEGFLWGIMKYGPQITLDLLKVGGEEEGKERRNEFIKNDKKKQTKINQKRMTKSFV